MFPWGGGHLNEVFPLLCLQSHLNPLLIVCWTLESDMLDLYKLSISRIFSLSGLCFSPDGRAGVKHIQGLPHICSPHREPVCPLPGAYVCRNLPGSCYNVLRHCVCFWMSKWLFIKDEKGATHATAMILLSSDIHISKYDEHFHAAVPKLEIRKIMYNNISLLIT